VGYNKGNGEREIFFFFFFFRGKFVAVNTYIKKEEQAECPWFTLTILATLEPRLGGLWFESSPGK
jgi:hypothetical protein